MNINLVVYCDDIIRIESALLMPKRRLMKEGITINHLVHPEFYLENEMPKNVPRESILNPEEANNIPAGSIVVVHSNARKEYQNVSRVRNLIPLRADLKYVLSYDESCGRFKDQQDKQIVETALEAGFHARNQVVIVPYNIVCFFDGHDYGSPIEESLENYCKQQKQLRGEQ